MATEDANTLNDLARLMPEISAIDFLLTFDKRGRPEGIERLEVFGHEGEELASVSVDQLEIPFAVEFDNSTAYRYPFERRLPLAVKIMEWLDFENLEELPSGMLRVELPSPRHTAGHPPAESSD